MKCIWLCDVLWILFVFKVRAGEGSLYVASREVTKQYLSTDSSPTAAEQTHPNNADNTSHHITQIAVHFTKDISLPVVLSSLPCLSYRKGRQSSSSVQTTCCRWPWHWPRWPSCKGGAGSATQSIIKQSIVYNQSLNIFTKSIIKLLNLWQ